MKNLFLQIQNTPGQVVDDNPTILHDASDSVANGMENLGAWLGLTGPVLNIVGGLLLLIVGYFIAKAVGKLIQKAIGKTGVDEKTKGGMTISKFVGQLVYYLLMIIVLMATLSMMGVNGDVLAPLNEMTREFFSAIPNIIAAGVIAYVGYFLAKIVSNLIEASGDKIRGWFSGYNTNSSATIIKDDFDNDLDNVRSDFNDIKDSTAGFDVVGILKNIAFIFVFVPILIVALEQLNMTVITVPATNMLSSFMNAIPNLVYAIVILLVAVIGGKFIVNILKNLLVGFNLNQLAEKLNISKLLGNSNLVEVIGNIVYFFIVYIGVIEACRYLGLLEVVTILDEVLEVAGRIIFGLLIIALGSIIAKFTTKLFLSANGSNKFMATIIKGAVMVIFLAMGLHAMGIADNIVELAFGLSMGALAVAFALSFGLGGREAAGQEVKEFFQNLKKKDL